MKKKDLSYTDATLYVSVAVFVFLQGVLSSEEAYKYCNPYLLFWCKAVVGSCAAGAGARKMYRSDRRTPEIPPSSEVLIP
jgi:hypothetical protein